MIARNVNWCSSSGACGSTGNGLDLLCCLVKRTDSWVVLRTSLPRPQLKWRCYICRPHRPALGRRHEIPGVRGERYALQASPPADDKTLAAGSIQANNSVKSISPVRRQGSTH
jgi:hypothetical protein